MDNFLSKEVKPVKTISIADKLFQLECEVSMLTDLVQQLMEELNKQGITVSTKINYDFDEE